MIEHVMVPLSAVATRIVNHTDNLAAAISDAALEARGSLAEQASTHQVVLETSLSEKRNITGYPDDVSVSHTVSITAGGILISVLATAILAMFRGDDTGDEW
jgi:hypothetical protein